MKKLKLDFDSLLFVFFSKGKLGLVSISLLLFTFLCRKVRSANISKSSYSHWM